MRGHDINQASERLTELDAMRGIAALLVLGYHLHTQFGGFTIFARSYLAVDFFFMLSGFVMARTYEDRLRDGRLKTGQFILARYRRLWAPVAVGTLIGCVYWVLAEGGPTFGMLAAGVSLFPAIGLERPYPLNRPAWSIFFELVANAIHAVLLSRVSTRIVLAVAAISSVALFSFAAKLDGLSVGYFADTFWGGIPRVLLAYCLGVAICRCGFRIPASGGTATLVLVLVLLAIPRGIAWDMAFVMLVCPALIAAGSRSFMDRFSSIVGAISFPLYAVHYPIIELFRQMGMSPALTIVAVLSVAAIVGIVIDRRLLETLRMSHPIIMAALRRRTSGSGGVPTSGA